VPATDRQATGQCRLTECAAKGVGCSSSEESATSGQPLGDLVHVLNAFVQAGWPEAQRLVWRLEELFR
jgi:hypothetical protein